ncbi:hypothetical protein BD289DRAFT_3806 [Coniella lustricola]|uniref:P-loop containing nucleoside triphosphate hydrolase protein n=1 Tax=Coniella lustricola TaxID=2025994 RepID=A0A2T3ANV1_9PEZI|nr:hypothetical protein BD289DRAFT_3806 [Coniella lustricola]
MAPKLRYLTDTRVVQQSGTGARSLQVICAGLPRCATSSLQAALETPAMGYDPCMHMAHVAPHVDRLELVLACMIETDTEKRQKMLRPLFDGYASTADFPGIVFVDELMDMYPDALIILNQRNDAESWVTSFTNALQFFHSLKYRLITMLWKTDRLHYQVQCVAPGLVSSKIGTNAPLPSVKLYHAYNDWVRREASKRGRDILEWKAADGYGPICKFLGKDVPKDAQGNELEFPRVNDQKTMRFLQTILLTRGLLSWAALGAAGWAVGKYGVQLTFGYAKTIFGSASY